eukprot:1434830-Prymnesium_polylepis.1
MKFRTGIKIDGKIKYSTQTIALNYLRGWFILDLLAAFPSNLITGLAIFQSVDDTDHLLRLVRLLKLLRIVQLAKRFDDLLIHVALRLNPSLLRLLKLFAIMILVWHWTGCLWWYIGTLPASLVHGFEGQYIGEMDDSWGPTLGIQNATLSSMYVFSTFWSVSTLTGLNDSPPPENNVQALFHIMVIILGMIYQAGLISHMSSILANVDAAAAQRRQKLDTLTQHLRHRRVPEVLRDRIRGFF